MFQNKVYLGVVESLGEPRRQPLKLQDFFTHDLPGASSHALCTPLFESAASQRPQQASPHLSTYPRRSATSHHRSDTSHHHGGSLNAEAYRETVLSMTASPGTPSDTDSVDDDAIPVSTPQPANTAPTSEASTATAPSPLTSAATPESTTCQRHSLSYQHLSHPQLSISHYLNPSPPSFNSSSLSDNPISPTLTIPPTFTHTPAPHHLITTPARRATRPHTPSTPHPISSIHPYTPLSSPHVTSHPPSPHPDTSSSPTPRNTATLDSFNCPFHSDLSPCTFTYSSSQELLIRKHLNASHRDLTLTPAHLHDLARHLQVANGIKNKFSLCPHCKKYFNSSHNSPQNCINHPHRLQLLHDRHFNPARADARPDSSDEYEQKHADSPPPSPSPPLPQRPAPLPLFHAHAVPLALPASLPPFTFHSISHVIPRELAAEFTEALHPILHSIHNSIANNNHLDAADGLCKLLLFPSLTLRCKRGGSGRKERYRVINTLKSNLRLYRSGQPLPQLPPAQPRKHNVPHSPESRINSLTQQGHLSKALSQLKPPQRIPYSPTLIQHLNTLNPDRHPDSLPFPNLPANCPVEIATVSPVIALKSLTKLNRGTAPGPSGTSISHLLFIMRQPLLAPLLCSIITYIINGKVTGEARTRLLASRLIPVPKVPLGDEASCPPANKIRPIAVGESLYRVATHIALAQCGQLSLLFPRIQKGLHKSGIERTLHNIHAHLELTHHIIKSPAVGIAVDFRAAYQTLDRGLIASAVLDTQALAPIWRAFHWAYSEHSPLLIFDSDGTLCDHIASRNGVRQGDTLASIAFAVAVQPLFTNCLVGQAVGHAIMDDFTITGPHKDVISSFDNLASQARRIHFPINFDKTFIFYPALQRPPTPPPQDLQDWALIRHNLSIRSSAQILGSIVSFSDPDTQTFLDEILHNDLLPHLRILSKDAVNAQAALLLVKAALIPKFYFLARTLDPTAFIPFANRFDQEIRQLTLQKLDLIDDVKPDSLAAEQLVLPFRFGGRGICSLAALTPFCTIASLASTISDLTGHALPPGTTPSQAFPTLHKRFEDARTSIAPLHAAVDNPHKPPPFILAWSYFKNRQPPPRFQSLLSTPFYQEKQAQLLQRRDCNEYDRRRIRGFAQPNTTRHLTTLPTSDFFSFNQSEYHFMHRIFLGLPLPSAIPGHCLLCDSKFDPLYTLHPFSCPSTRRNNVTFRHNCCLNSLVRMAQAAGTRTTIEPRVNMLDSRKPDLLIQSPAGDNLLIDVTILHSATPARILKNIDSKALLADASRAKLKKYEDGIPAGTNFKAAAATAFGELSKDLLDIFSFLAAESASNNSPDTTFQPKFIVEFISSIHRGNAHIVRDWSNLHKLIASHPRQERTHRAQALLKSVNADAAPHHNSPFSADDYDEGLSPAEATSIASASAGYRPTRLASQPIASNVISALSYSASVSNSISPIENYSISAQSRNNCGNHSVASSKEGMQRP